MRVALIAFVAVAVLSVGAKDASARGGPYHSYLRQLEETVEDLASGGWMSRDLHALRRAVGHKPQGKYPHAYQSFVRMLFAAAERLHSGGFMSNERKALEILMQANPDPGRASVTSGNHEAFVKAWVGLAENLHRAGFMSAERDVLKMLIRAAPTLKHPPRLYDRTYPAWSDALRALERRLRSGGMMSSEKEILGMLENLRPQRAVDAAGLTPPPAPPPAPPPDLDDDVASGSPGVVTACRRTYRVSWQGRRPRRHRDKVIRLLLLSRTTELLELDESTCRERWVADHVSRVVPVRGTGSYVLLREGGLALLVDKHGDVFRLKRNITGCRSDRPRHFTLTHRRGRPIEMKIEGRADASGQPLSINGRRRNAVRLYRPSWRQLDR